MKFQKDSPRPIVLIRGLLREQRHWEISVSSYVNNIPTGLLFASIWRETALAFGSILLLQYERW